MDGQRFDALARQLAKPTSRRGFVGRATTLAVTMGLWRNDASAKERLYGVCHRSGSGTSTYLRVNQAALRGHARHGDAVNVDLLTDPANCGMCGRVCADEESCINATCLPVCTGPGLDEECTSAAECCAVDGPVDCADIIIVGQPRCCLPFGATCDISPLAPCCAQPGTEEGIGLSVHCGTDRTCGGIGAGCAIDEGGRGCVSGRCCPNPLDEPRCC